MGIYALDGRRPDFPANGGYWVAPTAAIIGNVRLDKGASIWFGAVLRGDNELIHIGPDSNIQDLSALHTDPGFPLAVGVGCTIGHRAMLHGCTIGDNSLIGMGATILNGRPDRPRLPDRRQCVDPGGAGDPGWFAGHGDAG